VTCREALGQSRGGLSTKLHLVADRRCRPIARILTPGQWGDSPQFVPLLESIRIRRRSVGRPRKRPARGLADKAYSSRRNRRYLRRHSIQAVIPIKKDQAAHRRNCGSNGGRPPSSTGTPTRNATPSNTASTACASTAPSLPATTKDNSSTRAPLTSPRSASGSKTRHMITGQALVLAGRLSSHRR
jgi:transposase